MNNNTKIEIFEKFAIAHNRVDHDFRLGNINLRYENQRK